MLHTRASGCSGRPGHLPAGVCSEQQDSGNAEEVGLETEGNAESGGKCACPAEPGLYTESGRWKRPRRHRRFGSACSPPFWVCTSTRVRIDEEKLKYVMELKNVRRGRIKEYTDKYKNAVYTENDSSMDHNPLWNHKADCSFPSATQNEINATDAQNLLSNGIYVVSEGANMPTTIEGINIFQDNKILYGPGKAANAGGVAVSGLEMTQNGMRMPWSREEVDNKLRNIMKSIHKTCVDTAERFDHPGNYVVGANIGGFLKVADAMMDQGVV